MIGSKEMDKRIVDLEVWRFVQGDAPVPGGFFESTCISISSVTTTTLRKAMKHAAPFGHYVVASGSKV